MTFGRRRLDLLFVARRLRDLWTHDRLLDSSLNIDFKDNVFFRVETGCN